MSRACSPFPYVRSDALKIPTPPTAVRIKVKTRSRACSERVFKLLSDNFVVRNLVPGAGIEPALPKELDFESSASTNSATQASVELDGKNTGVFEFS